MLERVRPVVGRITAIEQNRERLESLGTMAAGLAHELNNPAAAAKRASAELADALDVLSSTIGLFVESGVSREQAEQLVQIQRAVLEACRARATISQLELADAEDELTGALEAAGVADAYRIVEPLAQAGFDEQQLQRVQELAGPATEPAVRWIAASLLARELAAELSESTERMSKLVGAVKMYAYMDRGGLVEVDVREGLDTTLTILGHKLKHTTIEVVRDIDEDLPRFQAYGAELNQVWTNLLDNAIDALGESGTITISAHRDGDCVEVDIADDGPGVPPEAAERIFDPFFTTKEVGKGTGLGLDTARRIVVDRHHGSLTLRTRAGAARSSASACPWSRTRSDRRRRPACASSPSARAWGRRCGCRCCGPGSPRENRCTRGRAIPRPLTTRRSARTEPCSRSAARWRRVIRASRARATGGYGGWPRTPRCGGAASAGPCSLRWRRTRASTADTGSGATRARARAPSTSARGGAPKARSSRSRGSGRTS